MACHQALRNTERAPLLRDDLYGFFHDIIPGSLSVERAAAKIVNQQIRGRASPVRVVAAAVELLREQATEIERLSAELDRTEDELERLRAGAEPAP